MEKEDFFTKLKNKCPDNEEIQRRRDIIGLFKVKNGEKLLQLYCKGDVISLAEVFEKFRKVSVEEFDINPLYCVSLPGFIWQCGFKNTVINLQALQDKDFILLIENIIRGAISSVLGDRYIISDDTKKILYVDANIFYGWAMSQSLPYDEIEI